MNTRRRRKSGRLAGVAAAVAVGVLLGAVAGTPGRAPLEAQRFARVAGAPLTASAVAAPAGWHGGATTASTGETVEVWVSDAYTGEPNTPQRWANFFAGLVHGQELGRVRVHVTPLAELQQQCGPNALGCFFGGIMFVPGDTVGSDQVTPDEVARHEYGHHVGMNRQNPPWTALDWGTKRWATVMGVCQREKAHTAFPGNEDWGYALNPGEALAESYRVLNEVRQGATGFTWRIVDVSFSPTAAALDALEQDVRTPWTAPTAATKRLQFARTGPRTQTWNVATPLDGVFELTATLPVASPYRVVVTSADGRQVLGTGLWSGSRSKRLAFTVCGTREVRVTVTRVGEPGAVLLRALTA